MCKVYELIILLIQQKLCFCRYYADILLNHKIFISVLTIQYGVFLLHSFSFHKCQEEFPA